MRYFHKQQTHFWKPVINLDKVHKSHRDFVLASRDTATHVERWQNGILTQFCPSIADFYLALDSRPR